LHRTFELQGMHSNFGASNGSTRGAISRGQQQSDYQLKQLASVRSSSAPPIMPNDFTKVAPTTESISPQDPRLDPAYYAYYYAQRPLDPRLPPPLISPYTHYSTFVAASQQSSGLSPTQGQSSGFRSSPPDLSHLQSLIDNEEDDTPWPSSSGGNQLDQGLKPKSLVDKIQSDFPRTPSPIYQKAKAEEALAATLSNNALPNRVMLQPQPQHARSQLLQHTAPNYNNARMKDIQNQIYFDATNELSESLGDMSLEYNNNNIDKSYNNIDKSYNNDYDNYKRSNNGNMNSNNNGYYGTVHGFNGQQQQQQQQIPQYMPVHNILQNNNNNYNIQRSKSNGSHGQMYIAQGGIMGITGVDYYNTWGNDNNINTRNNNNQRIFTGNNNNNNRTNDRSLNNNNYYNNAPSSPKDTSRSTMLEEFRVNKNRKYELSDIMGHVVEFSGDQHGSRFIQQKLESCNDVEKDIVFNEIFPHAMQLMVDVFGNYVIQKFFEFGSQNQRLVLCDRLRGHVLPLSLQMYGCRVIQKAIEGVGREEHEWIAKELEGNIMKCVKDQNGNHVIQKCIEKMPADIIQFIIDSFQGEQVYQLATHSYGCRVVQRILEYAEDSQRDPVMDELMRCSHNLVQDKYGNYVIQHVLEHGKRKDKSLIIARMRGQIVQLSQHKFASNVIEKCVQYGTPQERLGILEEISASKNDSALVIMMKDQFANYVIQKIIDVVDDQQRELLVQRIRPHLPALKKCTYSKHIITHVEKLMSIQNR